MLMRCMHPIYLVCCCFSLSVFAAQLEAPLALGSVLSSVEAFLIGKYIPKVYTNCNTAFVYSLVSFCFCRLLCSASLWFSASALNKSVFDFDSILYLCPLVPRKHDRGLEVKAGDF